MVEGGMKCIKFLLFSFNFIFVVVGIGLIAAGAVVLTAFKEYTEFLNDDYYGPAVFLIIVGVVIFGIASFGCCGAFKENYHCVMAFAVLLGVIFILEIAAGIAAFVYKDDIQNYAIKQMKATEKDYAAGDSGVVEAWDDVQREFSCCGVENQTEWRNVLNGSLPDSCCTHETPDCGKGAGPFFTENCRDSFIQQMKNNIVIIGGCGVGLAFVQFVGILFACCLGRAIRKEYEVV